MVSASNYVSSATTIASGREPWLREGAENDMVLLKDINRRIGESSPGLFTPPSGERLVFQANDGASGTKRRATAGTADGTTRRKDLEAGSSYSLPFKFPRPPATPIVALAHDTRLSHDDVDSDNTKSVSGVELGGAWEYSLNAGPNWTAGSADRFTLAAGSYGAEQVQARLFNVNGGAGTPSMLGDVTIDTAAPDVPFAVLVNDTASPLDGTAAGGAVNVSGLKMAPACPYSADGEQSWAVDKGGAFALAAASYNAGQVPARQINLAGNAGSVQPLGAMKIDKTAPDVPASVALAAIP